MSKANEFSRCHGLFGVCTHSSSKIFEIFSKKYDSITIAESNDFEFSDIVIIDTVKTLMQIRNFIHHSMKVIVTDSAINLYCVDGLKPLDFKGNPMSSSFELIKLKQTLESFDCVLTNTLKDPLTEYLSSISDSTFLTIYNKVSSYLNMPARRKLNHCLVYSLLNENPNRVLEYLKELNVPYYSGFESTFMKCYPSLCKAIKEYQKGTPLLEVCSKYNLDSYDITFIDKLIRKTKVTVSVSSKKFSGKSG